jgi:hypothetical protein
LITALVILKKFVQQIIHFKVEVRIALCKLECEEIGWARIDWIHLARNEDQRRAHVNTLMNFRAP